MPISSADIEEFGLKVFTQMSTVKVFAKQDNQMASWLEECESLHGSE